MEKKKKTIVILGLSLLIILLLGGTYAWLSVSVTSNTKQVIHAGKLDLVLDDETSDGIHMESVVPVSDKKGREQEGYTFRLINQGSISSKYTVYLDDLDLEESEVRMKDSAVKYSLERDGVELSSGLLPSIGSNPNRVLDTGIINGHTTYVYKLKVWMDIDATSENMDTVFYAKIRVETEQTNIPIKKSEMELTPESQEKVPIKDGEDPRDYTYTSSDWNVVKVDEEGNIEVIGPGYATITKKDQYGGKEEIIVHVTVPVEATFETNDKINSVGSVESNTCNLTENNQVTCQIKVPNVEVKEGYEFIGWSTDINSHEGEKENADISIERKILYPIVKKIGATHQATIVESVEGVKSIDGGDLTCKEEDTYNNEEIKTGCKVTLPTITPEDGYTVIGWSTDPNAEEGIASGGEVEITGETTFYPIVKKDVLLITATFKLNGATSLDGQANDITKSCKVHINSAGEALDECEVEVPVITASTETPIVVGFNEMKEATIAQILPEVRTITINKNTTYYAITRNEDKRYTVTFHKNGAKSLGGDTENTKKETCTILTTYNGEAQASKCSITSPSIEASENTPRIIGYSTSIDTHTSSWEPNKVKQISGDVDYYAQTANDEEIEYTATYQTGSNVTSVGKASDSCKVEASYNGEERENSCTVTAPTVTPKVGYTSVGYSETENDTTGSMNLILTKNTTFYANASANSYKIEYYSEGEKVGESGVQVGNTITLTTKESLGISKRGYSFKGWDTKAEATDTLYADGEEVSNLSTTEGAVVKLYAVYVDDIRPVCTFSELQDSYTVGDRFNLTITCTDEGSGLVETPSFDGISTNGIVSAYTGSGGTIFIVNILSSSYKFENGKLVLEYELEANSALEHDNYIVALGPKQIYDLSGNYNEYKESPKTIIYGKTFTATMTQDGVEGVDSIGTTASSCTTKADNRSCDVTLGKDVTVKDGYRWAGWSTDKTATQGNFTFNLTDDNTVIYPVTGPILVDTYLYNQDLPEGTQGRCITGEESTCEKTTCYKDGGTCATGTIFKYAVKSTYNDPDTHDMHRVDSLNDHIYYFYVIEDKGTTITMQSREDTTYGIWSENIADGPVGAISNLEYATNSWEYVDMQKYTMGTTIFGGDSSNTSCDTSTLNCNTPFYTWSEKEAKARMITVQEAKSVGCTSTNDGGCPVWMFNYLVSSKNYGGTNNVPGAFDCYWTMNAGPWKNYAMFIYNAWIVQNAHNNTRGIRAVIELDKTKLANWKQ